MLACRSGRCFSRVTSHTQRECPLRMCQAESRAIDAPQGYAAEVSALAVRLAVRWREASATSAFMCSVGDAQATICGHTRTKSRPFPSLLHPTHARAPVPGKCAHQVAKAGAGAEVGARLGAVHALPLWEPRHPSRCTPCAPGGPGTKVTGQCTFVEILMEGNGALNNQMSSPDL